MKHKFVQKFVIQSMWSFTLVNRQTDSCLVVYRSREHFFLLGGNCGVSRDGNGHDMLIDSLFESQGIEE